MRVWLCYVVSEVGYYALFGYEKVLTTGGGRESADYTASEIALSVQRLNSFLNPIWIPF